LTAVTSAFRDGVRRVNGAPMVVAGLFGVTLLIGLPLSYVLRGMITDHLGTSLAAEAAATGINYDWWQEFAAQATGLGKTFTPAIVGFGAVLEDVNGILDNLPLASAIAGVTAAWLVVWSFLSGGTLDRLARARRTRAPGFFAACGMHFWRLLRLGAVALAAYAFLFRYVHGWMFLQVIPSLTRDITVERTAFMCRVAGYLLFGGLLVACNIIFDYARIRIVVEDRRSAIGALLAGGRFVRRHAGGVVGLYALNAVAFLLLIGIYGVIAPGAPGAGWSVALALAVGEAYIVARLYLKLLFYASETALFQAALAHAAYTAAPAVVWPDSPAAESITNADRSQLS
jgi:hypothetical protein